MSPTTSKIIPWGMVRSLICMASSFLVAIDGWSHDFVWFKAWFFWAFWFVLFICLVQLINEKNQIPDTRNKPITRHLQCTYIGHHRRGNFAQRQDLVYPAELDRLFWHSEHHATGFILGDRISTGLFHLQHPFRAVAAHSGENHADGI